jgi:hypothetical protein
MARWKHMMMMMMMMNDEDCTALVRPITLSTTSGTNPKDQVHHKQSTTSSSNGRGSKKTEDADAYLADLGINPTLCYWP